jgi:hypothetical protein
MKIFKYLKTTLFFISLLLSISLSAERGEFSIQKKALAPDPITFAKISSNENKEWERKPDKESECQKNTNGYVNVNLTLEKITIKSYSVNNFISRRKNQATLSSFPLSIQFSKKLSGVFSSAFPTIPIKNYCHIVAENVKDFHKRHLITLDELESYETSKNIPKIYFQLDNASYDYKFKLEKINFNLKTIPPVKENLKSPKFSSTILPKFTFAILETSIPSSFSYSRPKTLADTNLKNEKFLKTCSLIKCKLDSDITKLHSDAKLSNEIVRIGLNLEEENFSFEKNSSKLIYCKSCNLDCLKNITVKNVLFCLDSPYFTKTKNFELNNLDLSKSEIDLDLKKNCIALKKPVFISNLNKIENIEILKERLTLAKLSTTPYQIKRSAELAFYKTMLRTPELAIFKFKDANSHELENNSEFAIKPPKVSLDFESAYIKLNYAKRVFSPNRLALGLLENQTLPLNPKPSFHFIALLNTPDTNIFYSFIDCSKQKKIQNPSYQHVAFLIDEEKPYNFVYIGLKQSSDFSPKYTLLKETQVSEEQNDSRQKKGFLERIWRKASQEISKDPIDEYTDKETNFKIKSKGYRLKDLDCLIPEKKLLAKSFSTFEKNKFHSNVATLPKPKKYKTFNANEENCSFNFQLVNKNLDIRIAKLKKSKYDYLKPYKTNLKLYSIEDIETPRKSTLLAPSKLIALEDLINFLPKNAIDGKRGFIKSFFVQEALLVAYKQVYEKEKLNIEFIANTELELPKKIDYFIQITHNSKSKNSIYSNAIAQTKPLITSKEYVFPKKSYIQGPKIPSTPFIYTIDTQKNETVYCCAPLEDLESLSMPRSFKWNLETNLITKDYIKASFLPSIKYENYFIHLYESEQFTTRDSLISEWKSINKMNRYTLKNLCEIPSLDDLNTFNLSSEFKLEGFQIPKMDGSGYAFELNLSSYNSDILEPVDGKIYFIIDRGNGIENHRFQSFKNAIVHALNYVPENSTFNIIAFDNEAIRLSDSDLKATKSSIKYVNKTLEKLGQKWSSSFMGFISAVEKIQKEAVKSSAPTRIILLSNGQFMKNIRFNREALCKVFKDLSSNVSISTVAISDNNNLQMLELISKLGKGEFLHSQTHAAFPRKLSVLTRRIQNPLMTDIRVHILNSDNKVQIASNSSLAPFVYGDKVFSIHGQTKKLEPIHVMIQGKSGDKWIQVCKKIDLSEAERSKSVDKDLSEKEALEHIMNFIFTNDQKELLKARELTRPFDIKWL